jgi:hypothetical protein
MVPFAEDLDAERIHVQAPTDVIFLCGGEFTDVNVVQPKSFRDAFLKIIGFSIIENRDLIQAEEITKLSVFHDHYSDILEFETDLAQITALIIIFCESEGSLAELGAFSMLDEISSRLFAIARGKYWNNDSFIKLGPLQALINKYGDGAVFVINDDDVGIVDGDIATIDRNMMKNILETPLENRLSVKLEPSTFDFHRAGHLIKLIVGLIQEYGGLSIEEIDELLLHLDVYVPTPKIKAYLLCAISVNWIVADRRGHTTYYFSKNGSDAATIRVRKDAAERNRDRRRAIIREYWKENDPIRFAGIVAASMSAVV